MGILKLRIIILLSSVAFISVGCGTPEYKASYATCYTEMDKKIPAVYEKQQKNETRSMSVPSANGSEIAYYTVPVMKDVMVNNKERNNFLHACVKKKCLKRGLKANCKQ